MKRFAQRYSYLQIDGIASRDLGGALNQEADQGPSSGSSNALGRRDTAQSLMANAKNQTGGGNSTHKRPASPEHRKRDDRPNDYSTNHKRARPLSPTRERDRERWEAPPRRRAGSPGWDRERERERDAPPPPRRIEREREEEKSVTLPPIISWFVGQLPAPAVFDGQCLIQIMSDEDKSSFAGQSGPVFRTDDLMTVFRNAVIPSSTARMRSPPPSAPPRGGK